MRFAFALLAVVVLGGLAAGCADDAVMKNPRTGVTEICRESFYGLNPWSQKMACVGNHEAQGWVRLNPE